MPVILVNILIYFASSLVARMLLGAGLGIISYNFIDTLMQNLQDALLAALNGFPADIVGIIGLLRIDFYLSIILSAMTMAAFIKSSKIALGKV